MTDFNPSLNILHFLLFRNNLYQCQRMQVFPILIFRINCQVESIKLIGFQNEFLLNLLHLISKLFIYKNLKTLLYSFFGQTYNSNLTIKIMKQSLLLIRPAAKNQSLQKQANIFSKCALSQSLPSIHKSLVLERPSKLYDFVGPTQFKLKKFFTGDMKATDGLSNKMIEKNDHIQKSRFEGSHQTTKNLSKMANTTINRQTILSKLSKHQQIEASKQKRNIERHKEYQEYWDTQVSKLKRLINKKGPSVVEVNDQVMIQENPDKQEIINENIVHYWQMSLRNHNPILKRHIKGNRYGQVQLQQKLQMSKGIKQVEASIPKLPLQSLKKIKSRDLLLTGRSKSLSENQTLTERQSFVPFSNRDRLKQQEVFKINYKGEKKWQGTENLY